MFAWGPTAHLVLIFFFCLGDSLEGLQNLTNPRSSLCPNNESVHINFQGGIIADDVGKNIFFLFLVQK